MEIKALQTAKELLSLEAKTNDHYLLLNKFSLGIKQLPKSSLKSQISRFYHTKLIKDSLEFEDAIAFIALLFRQQFQQLIEYLQKKLAESADHRHEAKQLQTIFDEIEEDMQSVAYEDDPSQAKKLLHKTLQEAKTLLIKTKKKFLDPLIVYVELIDLWASQVEGKMQDVINKNLDEKIPLLKETGLILATLVLKKKYVGDFEPLLDIDGKNLFFLEKADNIFQSILKDSTKSHHKGIEELKLFRAYINLLKNPEESRDFLNNMREAFLTKYQDSIDQAEGVEDLYHLHEEKTHFEKKAHLLKITKEKYEQKLKKIREQIHSPSELNLTSLQEILQKIQSTPWPNSLKETQNKVIETLKAVKSSTLEERIFRQLDQIRLKITSEIVHRRIDLFDLNQSLENYSDRLNNEREVKKLQDWINLNTVESFVSHLIRKKGEQKTVLEDTVSNEIKTDSLMIFNRSKEIIAHLTDELKIDKDPLYVTKDDLASPFFSMTSPFMTEGIQGKLPEKLNQIKERVDLGLIAIDVLQQSPFFGLALEQEQLRAQIKEWEALVGPIDELMDFLRKWRDRDIKKTEIALLTKKKKTFSNILEKFEKEQKVVERDLYVLEGIEAVLIELIVLKINV